MKSADDVPTPPPLPAPGALPLGEIPDRPEGVTATLPLPPAAETPEQAAPPATAGIGAFLDRLMVGLVLLFALVIASAPARNSDLWLHLASGRLLAQGTYPFGVDPFSYATAGAYWANHSWLYDLISYFLFQVLGGWALVGLKAALLGALALVLLYLGRPPRAAAVEETDGQQAPLAGLWLSGICTALAFLALAPWTALQPVCVSYLFLGLTLWLLVRTDRRLALAPRPPAQALAAFGPLFVLFVLWVNLDAWFLLGPLTVALYAVGALFPGRGEEPRGAGFPTLALVFVVGLAACLINPHHYHAFVLPPQLGPGVEALRREPVFAAMFLSPFDGTFYRASLGPIIAYGLLAVLGLLSFIPLFLGGGSSRSVPAWRVLIWVAFFLFSLWRAWAIPFFAVAATPVLALNLQDLALRRREQPARRDLRRPIAFRFAAVLAALLLVAGAWPGWVQGRPSGAPRWGLVPDPSLEKAAGQLARWQQDKRLGHGLNFSTHAANYLAWLAPEEQGFFDSRLHGNAAQWMALRRALLASGDSSPGEQAERNWRDLFRKYGIDHVILDEAAHPRLRPALAFLANNPQEWDLIYLRGHTAVFTWKGGLGSRADRIAALDLDRRAFQPTAEDEAPPEGPGRSPETLAWWHSFTRAAAPPSLDREEASVCLALFDLLSPVQAKQNQTDVKKAWQNGQAVGLAALPFLGDGTAIAVGCGLRLQLLLTRPEPYAPGIEVPPFHPFVAYCHRIEEGRRDDGPPGLPLLAIRAARRALRANPEDVQTYMVLAKAYLRLTGFTAERAWYVFPMVTGEPFLALDQLRHVQILTALNQALVIQPDLEEAHRQLALIYENMGMYEKKGYKDLALQHLKEYVAARRAAGPKAGETPEQFAEVVSQFERDVEDKDAQISELLERHEVNVENLPVASQAEHAVRKGLAKKALETLLGSSVADFGAEGARLELDLFLKTGRLNEVRESLDPDLKDLIGPEDFYHIAAQTAAAAGDYQEADRSLDQLSHPPGSEGTPKNVPGPETVASMGIADWILREPLRRQTIGWELVSLIQDKTTRTMVQAVGRQLRKEVDAVVLRGLLAVESGDVAQAVKCFEEARVRGQHLPSAAQEAAERALRLLARNRK